MEKSQCPDCRKVIGGEQHRFLGEFKISDRLVTVILNLLSIMLCICAWYTKAKILSFVRHENRTFPFSKEKCTKIAIKDYCSLGLTKIEKKWNSK